MTDSKFSLNNIKKILDSSPIQISTNVSNTDKKSSTQRKVGDKWEDEDGHIWEQKDGYKLKVSKNHEALQKIRDELSIPSNCPKCGKSMMWQDKKFYRSHKMCMNCVIAFEHELKLDGKYEEYEKDKIKQNALAWLRDAEAEVEIVKNSFKTEYVNEDGTIEKWSSDIPPEVMAEQFEQKFIEFKKEFLKNLNS